MIQTQLDFSRRGEQLRLLDRIQFERGLGVSPATLVLVLRVVDSFAGESGWCWASLTTMAGRANLGSRTVARALGVLVDGVLIRKQARIGQSGNRECRYQVVWSNVHAHVEEFKPESQQADGWADVHPTITQQSSLNNQTGDTRRPTSGQTHVTHLPDQRPNPRHPVVNLTGGSGQSGMDQRPIVPGPVVTGAPPHGHSGQVSAIEPQENRPPPLPSGGHATRATPIHPALRAEPYREEEAILELLAGTVCRSEAVRLSQLADLDDCRRAVAEYRHSANRHRIRSPGALVHRLEFGEWPDPSIQTLEQLQAADAARARLRATAEAVEAERSQKDLEAKQRAEELERQHGPALDAMSIEETQMLASHALDDFSLERFLRGADYRESLLEYLGRSTITRNGIHECRTD